MISNGAPKDPGCSQLMAPDLFDWPVVSIWKATYFELEISRVPVSPGLRPKRPMKLRLTPFASNWPGGAGFHIVVSTTALRGQSVLEAAHKSVVSMAIVVWRVRFEGGRWVPVQDVPPPPEALTATVALLVADPPGPVQVRRNT